MKLAKTLALGSIALATVASTYATNVVVTGSTAYRKALYAAIVDQLSAGNTKTVYCAYYNSTAGTALNSCAQVTFSNGADSVQCCMAGSVGGVNWVINNTPVATSVARTDSATAVITPSYVDNHSNAGVYSVSNVLQASGAYLATPSTDKANLTSLSTTIASSATADFTMSDSLQDSTPYDSTSTGLQLSQAGTNANITLGVGVVPFVFAKGDATGVGASGANLTNVTPLAFQALAANGYANLALFTGVAGDASYNVVLTGRDNDSGTRLAVAFETGFGNVNAAFKQYSVNNTTFTDVGSGATVSSLNLASSTALGYSSGGKVKNALNASMPASIKIKSKSVILLSYVGTGDIPANAKVLKYNGVQLIDPSTGVENDTVIQQGQYSFWTIEQAYYNPNRSLSSSQLNLINGIADAIESTYASAAGGVFLDTLQVARASEGAVISHN